MYKVPDILPTSVVGSYAWPSWLHTGLEAAQRGDYGSADIHELLNDAVDTAIRDQEEAGIDIISDGEMRRAGFFTAAFYGHLTGLKPLPPDRRVGAAGHDQQHRFDVQEPITAPHGFETVKEFEYARKRTDRRLKVLIPGPFTLAGRLMRGEGKVYKNREEVAWAFVPLINAELKILVAAGATHIQIDEPSPAIHPEEPVDFSALFNAAVEGVTDNDDVYLGSHLCFGNYVGRPLSRRTYLSVLDQIKQFNVQQLVLEFANREFAEIEILSDLAQTKDLAVGVVDVKNYYIESPEEVAARIRRVLKYVPVERLSLVPDCGFSETARWAARAKLQALGAGARIVRDEISATST